MADAGADEDDDAALLGWLAVRDAPCPVCGYNRRAVPALRCPECNAALRLNVHSPNVSIGPWFLGTMGLSLALGFDGVVAVLMAVGLTAFPPPLGARTPALVLLGCFVALAAACGAGVAWPVRSRRWFWQLSPPRQWTLAWALFVVVGIGRALFGAWAALRLL